MGATKVVTDQTFETEVLNSVAPGQGAAPAAVMAPIRKAVIMVASTTKQASRM